MRKNGITTKRKILTVCVQLFLEQGYTNTTITQITEQAKVTRSSFQHLFPTKDAAFDDFLRVEVDGVTLDETNYTVKSGSTVVTLNADYAATLSVAEHTIGIVSQSGTATAKFTVNKKAAETTTATNKLNTNDNTKSPHTGDTSNLALWLALFLASGSAVTAAMSASKKKKYNK